MSNRLQVLVPPSLDRRLRKAAEWARVSKGEFVRQAIQRALATSTPRLTWLHGSQASVPQPATSTRCWPKSERDGVLNKGVRQVATFDVGFGGVGEIERVELQAAPHSA